MTEANDARLEGTASLKEMERMLIVDSLECIRNHVQRLTVKKAARILRR